MFISKPLFIHIIIPIIFICPILSQNYVSTWEDINIERKLIREWVNHSDCLNARFESDYLNQVFTPLIERSEVSIIFEIGSRDAIDAIGLSQYYKAPVYAFECYPEAIDVCKLNIGKNPNIHLIEMAVWNKNTNLVFKFCTTPIFKII